MVNDTISNKEKETQMAVLQEIEKNPRGITITGLQKNMKIPKCGIRIALAYLLGAGKIEEERASMAKLYYSI